MQTDPDSSREVDAGAKPETWNHVLPCMKLARARRRGILFMYDPALQREAFSRNTDCAGRPYHDNAPFTMALINRRFPEAGTSSGAGTRGREGPAQEVKG